MAITEDPLTTDNGYFANNNYIVHGYDAEDEYLITEWFTYNGVVDVSDNDTPDYVEFRQCIEDCSVMTFA